MARKRHKSERQKAGGSSLKEELMGIPELQVLREKPRKLLLALAHGQGTLSAAAKHAGCTRASHYNWMENDPGYKTAYEKVKKICFDYAFDASSTSAPMAYEFLRDLVAGKIEGAPIHVRMQAASKMLDLYQKFAIAKDQEEQMSELKEMLEKIKSDTDS